jgi:hypothetical protein
LILADARYVAKHAKEKYTNPHVLPY